MPSRIRPGTGPAAQMRTPFERTGSDQPPCILRAETTTQYSVLCWNLHVCDLGMYGQPPRSSVVSTNVCDVALPTEKRGTDLIVAWHSPTPALYSRILALPYSSSWKPPQEPDSVVKLTDSSWSCCSERPSTTYPCDGGVGSTVKPSEAAGSETRPALLIARTWQRYV